MSNTDQFDWVDFYKEFAAKLLQFRNNRSKLVENVVKIYDITGLQMPTLEKGNQLVDMDPFTVFGLFNKNSMKKENRVKILSAIAEIFNISAPVPTSFDSIPVLNSQNATFYYFVDERDESDIDDLWELFSAALAYASEPTAENRTKFSKYFDLTINKKGNGNSKITMGIYWIAPDVFLNLDRRNIWYIYDSGKMPAELVQTLPEIETKIPSEKYFDIVEKLRAFLQSDKSDLKNFKELSFEAWRYSEQVNKENRAERKTDWFPTLDEYDPGLSIEDWSSLLKDPEVFDKNSLIVVNAFLDIGGQATCKQLSEKYGRDPGFYNIVSSKLAKRIHAKTNCPLMPREISDNSRWWTILYLGKPAKGETSGNYIWKLREELKIALDRDSTLSVNNDTLINAWLLAWNPKNYDRENEIDEYSLDTMFKTVKSGGGFYISWRCRSSNIKPGDLVFFIRLGDEPKDVFASGYIIDYSVVKNGTRCAEVLITKAIDFRTNDILSQQMLENQFPEQEWSPQGSGISIKQEAAEWLIENWDKYIAKSSDDQTYAKVLQSKEQTYTKNDFLKEVFMTESEYDKLRSLVLRKKNIILQGAPGVGKTFSAKRLAYSIIGEENENRICMVQFHQNYSYEDFIMGYRPNDSGGFELQSGVFFNFCEKCKENPDMPYFFIIDEINRGNLSKIFGELMMLIETDKRGEKHKLNLVYGGAPFYIPENLHIIGMMNTADRSLAMIDYALRRRFSFYTMQPAFENAVQNGFGEYTQDISCELYHTVIAKIKELNNTIRKDNTLGKGFEIGHSYFAPENKSDINDEWVRGVVEYEIIPLIEEYWFDDDKKVEEWTNALYQALGDGDDR